MTTNPTPSDREELKIKEELLEILGNKLTANEFIQVLECISKKLKINFTSEIRIKIQNVAEKIDKKNGISGSQFESYLNKEIAPLLTRNFYA